MARWPGDTRERLVRAAYECFAADGFAATSVEQIAHAAGVTERTFFRHFADKGEVLFAEDDEYIALMFVDLHPPPARVLEVVIARMRVFTARVAVDRDRHVARAGIVVDAPALQERQLAKYALWRADLESALVAAGHQLRDTRLSVRLAGLALECAYDEWMETGARGDLVALFETQLAAFADLAAALARPAPIQLDLTQPVLIQPDLTRPDLTRPDLTRPDLTRPDLTQPDLTQPDLTRPDLIQPGPPPRSVPAPGSAAAR